MVFKLRLMLTGTLIFFKLNRRYSVLSGLVDSLFSIIHEKISLMQVSIDVKAEEANSGKNDRYTWVSSA